MLSKITREMFIEAVVNNDSGKINKELAGELGISEKTFYKLQREYKISKKDEARGIAQRFTGEIISHLRRNSKKGDTGASKVILEISEIYEPRKLDKQGQMQVNFFISGLKVPKDAGRSDTMIPERTGQPVDIPSSDYKVVNSPQPEPIIDKKVEENW